MLLCVVSLLFVVYLFVVVCCCVVLFTIDCVFGCSCCCCCSCCSCCFLLLLLCGILLACSCLFLVVLAVVAAVAPAAPAAAAAATVATAAAERFGFQCCCCCWWQLCWRCCALRMLLSVSIIILFYGTMLRCFDKPSSLQRNPTTNVLMPLNLLMDSPFPKLFMVTVDLFFFFFFFFSPSSPSSFLGVPQQTPVLSPLWFDHGLHSASGGWCQASPCREPQNPWTII